MLLKRILPLVLGVVLSFNVHSTACELLVNTPTTFVKSLGTVKFNAFGLDAIVFAPIMGDMSCQLNYNYLYQMTDGINTFYFRFNGQVFNGNSTVLSGVSWANNVAPTVVGDYIVDAYTASKAAVYNQTMVTIGDSITWSLYGRYLRCMLVDQGIGYDFIGEKTDTFGFAHEGEGGDNTANILARIGSIPVADAYFILAGTNDITLTPMQTVNNLMMISVALHTKSPNAIIYLSTLLPRYTPYLQRNLDVNAILLANQWGNNIQVLDTGGDFYSFQNWQTFLLPDILHPTYAGYGIITWSIMKNI